MDLRAPKGTDDILPPASRTWRRLFSTWEDLAERYGYDLIIIPTFELTEVFARGVGESTEVVQKQMYTFADKKGRSLTLRPEGTAGVVRAYLQAGSPGLTKVSYTGPMFRYEQPQAGRRRQFHQVGVEYLGTDAPYADAEVIELGYRFLVEVGVADVEASLNSLGDAACRPAYLADLRAWLEERRDELCADSQRTLDLNPLRVLDCKVCADIVFDAPTPVDALCAPCSEHFATVQARLDERGVAYRLDPRLVRGLDYYTRTAFEYAGSALDAAQTALGGGGRYDGLAELLGGSPVPGVGLALGIDRIVLALEGSEERSGIDAFVVAVSEGHRADAEAALDTLRDDGLRADMLPEPRSMRAQLKAADRRGARSAVIIGDEWAEGLVTVKDLTDGIQTQVGLEEVGGWLANR